MFGRTGSYWVRCSSVPEFERIWDGVHVLVCMGIPEYVRDHIFEVKEKLGLDELPKDLTWGCMKD